MAVVIETTVGDITVDLFTERRPQTCKNFLKLCKIKYYNFCLFHSIQANFIAQTGDPTGVGTGGESVFGVAYGNDSKYYEAEKVPKIKHDKAGLLSMVNCGNNMLGSQFFVTLSDDLQSLEEHCVFAEVTEGHEILIKLNDAICDNQYRPYQDIRITHTVILEDPFDDIPGLLVPIHSPDVSRIQASNGRIGADEKINDLEGLTEGQLNDLKAEREAKARATILEIVGDLPHADVAPPENVLFVCKLNPVTTDDDLEIIFSRFGKIKSCEVIRDHQSGDSLQYAFIEFEDQKSCEQAYLKMDNVLIDDRRIHVDFSQSVSKIKWRGKGRGVQYIDSKDDDKESSHYSDRYVSKRDHNRDRDRDNRDRNDRRRDDDRSRRRSERESEDRRRRDRRKDEPRRRDEENWREPDRYEEERKRREQLREERRREEERRHTRREERRREEERRRDSDKKRSNGSDRKHKESSRRSEAQVDPRKDSRDDSRVQENNRSKGVEIKREISMTNVKDAKPVDIPQKKILSEPEPSKPSKREPPVKEEPVNNVSSSSNDTPKLNHAVVAENDVSSDIVSMDKVDSMSASVSNEKDKKKKKRKRTSTTSASSSSDSSASTTSSSSVDRKKKAKRSLTVAKKYYHRGKLVKVVKKKKRKSSDSDTLSESSDSDRKKKKSKYSRKVVKVIKKKRRHSSDDSDSESSSSDDSDSSRYSRRRRKKHDRNNKKKRKDSGRKGKKKKSQNSSDDTSGSEDERENRRK